MCCHICHLVFLMSFSESQGHSINITIFLIIKAKEYSSFLYSFTFLLAFYINNLYFLNVLLPWLPQNHLCKDFLLPLQPLFVIVLWSSSLSACFLNLGVPQNSVPDPILILFQILSLNDFIHSLWFIYHLCGLITIFLYKSSPQDSNGYTVYTA